MKSLIYLKSPIIIDTKLFKKDEEDYYEVLEYLLENNLVEIDNIIYRIEEGDKK